MRTAVCAQTLQSRLGNARILVQVDVGIGDVVEPAPEWLDYPALLDAPAPRLRAYRPETTIAEKLHAMVVLGQANSRMRDFFDVYVLSERFAFDAGALLDAVRATFERRGTPIPTSPPLALTPEFAAALGKQAQWEGYLRKNRLSEVPRDLNEIVVRIATFLTPMITAPRDGESPNEAWSPRGPWRRAK